MSDSVRPNRQQPTRLPRPWDSPGKNTGVGCPFLLQCMKVKSESEVPQSCPTLCDPMDCSPPSSSVHGILQARVLEWGAIAFSDLSPKVHSFLNQFLYCLTFSLKNKRWKILMAMNRVKHNKLFSILKNSLIHFSQQIFIEHLLCQHILCTCWETIANKTDSPSFSEVYIFEEMRKISPCMLQPLLFGVFCKCTSTNPNTSIP